MPRIVGMGLNIVMKITSERVCVEPGLAQLDTAIMEDFKVDGESLGRDRER